MLNDSCNFFFFKVLSVAQSSLFLVLYYHLKMRFEKLNAMYDEIQHFLIKKCLFGHPFTPPLILFIVNFCLFYTCTLHNLLQNETFEKALHPILLKLFYCQMSVTTLLISYWIFIINYLLFEFHYQYNKLLLYHNTIIKRNMDKIPIPMTRYFIQDSLNNFKINNNEMFITITMLNKINIIFNPFLILKFLILDSSKAHFKWELYFLIFLLESYFLITQYYAILQRKTQNSLIHNLLKWREKYVIEYNIKCVTLI